jgi:hypothetical protein
MFAAFLVIVGLRMAWPGSGISGLLTRVGLVEGQNVSHSSDEEGEENAVTE